MVFFYCLSTDPFNLPSPQYIQCRADILNNENLTIQTVHTIEEFLAKCTTIEQKKKTLFYLN